MYLGELIGIARRLGGVPSGGPVMDTERQVVNSMLSSWWADGLDLNVAVKESFPLVANTVSYTIGPGGVFNTTKPSKILSAWRSDADGSVDTDFTAFMTREEYDAKEDIATNIAAPDGIYYDHQLRATLGIIYPYPVPDAAYTLWIESERPFTQFATVSDNINLPDNWLWAIIFNSAVVLGALHGTNVSEKVQSRAESSYNLLLGANARDAIARHNELL